MKEVQEEYLKSHSGKTFEEGFSKKAIQSYKQLFPDHKPLINPNQQQQPEQLYIPPNPQSVPIKTKTKYKFNQTRYQEWCKQAIPKKVNREFLNQTTEKKKVPKTQIFQSKKKIEKEKEPNMPQVISNPFQEQESLRHKSFLSSPFFQTKKIIHKNNYEMKIFCNPFFENQVNELKNQGWIPLKKQRKKKRLRKEKKVEEVQHMEQSQNRESSKDTKPKPLTPLQKLKMISRSRGQPLSDDDFSSLIKTQEVRENNVVKEEEKNIQNYFIKDPLNSEETSNPRKSTDYKTQKQKEHSRKLSIYTELEMKYQDKMKKIDLQIEETQSQSLKSDLLKKKKKYFREIQKINDKKISLYEDYYKRKPQKPLSSQKRETPWEKIDREKKQKKNKQNQLIQAHIKFEKERRLAQKLQFATNQTSSLRFQSYEDQWNKIHQNAISSLDLLYVKEKKKKKRSNDSIESSESEEEKKIEKEKRIKRGQKKGHRNEPDWKKQLKQTTGYNPRDKKFRNRDREEIKESGFDQIQREEKVSFRFGLKQEQQDLENENKWQKRGGH